MKISRVLRWLSVVLILPALLLALSVTASAADLDEILEYRITVDVNEDGTLRMVYHIDWKVLDSDSEGPLSWVTVGIPNKHYVSYEALSSTIRRISYDSAGGGSLRIDFDRKYYRDEVVSFEFGLVQDYLYEMNLLSEGETVYEFTPGWFNDLRVDALTLRWNGDKAESWSPSCEMDGEAYLVWRTSLGKGQKFTVSVTYPNDAFRFDSSKTLRSGDTGSGGGEDGGAALIGGFSTFAIVALIVARIAAAFRRYSSSANLGGGTTKKITRTKIEYYPACPGCGSPRPEGKDNCEYCGRSFIKSEEKIEEKDIPKEEKELRDRTENGLYRYSSSPNTYVRVNVVNVPVVRGGIGGSRSSGSGSGRSCACVSSCACACACACAGGGRAGCTTKDFYRTDLKLRQLELRNRRRAKASEENKTEA